MKKLENLLCFVGFHGYGTSTTHFCTEGFRVKTIIRKRIAARKRRVARRLDKHNYPDDLSQPMIRGATPRIELAARSVGTAHGGIALVQQLVRELGLAQEIDRRLVLFKFHLPYHESDHVLNLAYNALCDGRCLEDLELRRQDEAYLNLLGAQRLPDPTTAGDFCRRFERTDLEALQRAIDAARLKVWAQQSPAFFAQAVIEADGAFVETCGECKQGMDISYKGQWGYHPLLLTLANTGEVLRLVNRSGNRPSHEGAAHQFDGCITLCRGAGFRKIVLRGDTDFSQTRHLDRWHEQGDVQFIFGMDASPALHVLADDLPEEAWKPLKRPPKYVVQTSERARPARVKQEIVERRGFKDIQLVDEWVAEIQYRPTCCRHTYRLVVVRKELEVNEPAQGRLFDDYRYFFYITNDRDSTTEEVVFSANDRCDQENDVAQLRSVRALYAPVDNLLANEAYMLMTALAWNLKAWLALWLPEPQGDGPRCQERRAEKRTLLRMEFRTFVNYFLRLPAQVVRTGRQTVVRLLAFNRWQSTFFRLADSFVRPRRC